jgi:phage shock protein PspC (stress-responsive transcriptional regulator)
MTEEGEEKVDATTQEGAGPTPPPVAVRRTLTRSRSHRMFAGVAGGLGEYFGADPILFRLGFAILTVLGGAGVALYIAAWLLIPEEGEPNSIGEVALAKTKSYLGEGDHSWIWITALVVGGLIVISNLGQMGWDTGALFWAVLLICGGIWLYHQDRSDGSVTPVVPPVDPVNPRASGWTASSVTQPIPASRPVSPRAPVVPKPPPSRLGRYTFAMILVVLGILAMFDNGEVLDMGLAGYGAAALVTIGAGLLIGSVWGRARGPIFLGLLLVPFVLISDAAEINISAGSGERIYTPGSPAELAESHEMFAGHLVFDLSRMEWGSEPLTIDANLTIGQIEVLVPEGVDVDFRGHAEMGGINHFDVERHGTDVDLSSPDAADGGPELILDANVFMGEIQVDRSGTPAKELS